MAYKLYGRQVFTAEVQGQEYTFTCYGQDTSYGFRHICTLGWNNTTTCSYIKRDIIAKACYYNRTWERFKYETVLSKATDNLNASEEVKKELREVLIENRVREEHERAERSIQSFKSLYEGLTDKNKQHIKNGLGDNLIQTEEQAQVVMGVMKAMTLMQE